MATKAKPENADPGPGTATAKPSVYLIFGTDEYLVQIRAKQTLDSMVDKAAGDFGIEMVEGRSDNIAQAVTALKRVDEALNTLAFFGGGKTVWLKNANFLGTSRTAESKDVAAQVESLAQILKRGLPAGFSLIISATEVDKRRSFYKTVDKLGEVIAVTTANEWGKADIDQLESFALAQAKANQKTIREDALRSLIELTGNNYRALASELEKIATYVGDRNEITRADIAAIGSPSAESIVWELGDSIAERNLSRSLQILDRLLFQGENPMGLLFALVSKLRSMLLVREMLDRRLLPVPVPSDFPRFRNGFQRAAEQAGGDLSSDRKFNPLLQNPYAVFKTAQQVQQFTTGELQRAMQCLLEANQRLVSSSMDDRTVLEQTLAAIIRRTEGAGGVDGKPVSR